MAWRRTTPATLQMKRIKSSPQRTRQSRGQIKLSLSDRYKASDQKALLLLIFLLLPNVSLALQGQESKVSADEINNRLEALEATQNLDEDSKSEIREIYQQALEELDRQEKTADLIAAWERKIGSAPSRLRQARRSLSSVARPVVVRPPANTTLSGLEQELHQREEALRQARESFAELDAEPRRRAARLAEIPLQLQSFEQESADIGARIAAIQPTQEPGAANRARQVHLSLRQHTVNLLMESLRRERQAYEATSSLLPLQRDAASGHVSRVEAEVQGWRQVVNERRRLEADRQAVQALREALQASPAAVQIAQTNAQMANERQTLAEKLANATHQLEESRRLAAEITANFQKTREEIDSVGLSRASGQILRQQRAALPSPGDHRRRRNEFGAEFAAVQFKLYRHQDRRSGLANLENRVVEIVKGSPQMASQELQDNVRQLLLMQREFLDDLLADYTTYAQTLRELEAIEQQLSETLEEYSTYINERVLWLRSAPPFGFDDLNVSLDAAAWLFSPSQWSIAAKAMLEDTSRNLADVFVLPLLLLAYVSLRPRLKRRLAGLNPSASRQNRRSIQPTLEAIAWTMARSLLGPAVMWYLGWRWEAMPSSSSLLAALGMALKTTAEIYLLLELLRQICRPGGLAVTHFRWSTTRIERIAQNIGWYMVCGLPVFTIAATAYVQKEEPIWSSTFGRLAFLVFLALTAQFLYRIFPWATHTHKETRQSAGGAGQSKLYRMARSWAVEVVPLLLGVLALVGFFETAVSLTWLAVRTLWLMLGLAVAADLVSRWIRLKRRQLADQQKRQQKELEMPSLAAGQEAAKMIAEQEEGQPELDVVELSEQTKHFISTVFVVIGVVATWIIWSDVVPAFTILETIALGPGEGWFTLGGLILAVLIAVLTFWATKNIPALLEFAALERFPLDPGVRNAITTLCQYLIVLVGVILVGSFLGITWSSIQWLVAAVSVGLGFGLQEIFANFVSGVILLVERPIRIGDISTLR